MCTRVGVTVHVCGGERTTCSYHVGPRDQTQVVRIGGSTLTCQALSTAPELQFLSMESKGELLSFGQFDTD